MAYQTGKTFLLKLAIDGTGGTLAGMKNLSMKITNESVDVSNKSTGGWRELMEGAGLQSIDLTIDGLASDAATYETIKGYAQSNTINPFLIVGPDNDTVACNFHFADFTEQGSFNDALAFSVSMVSSGVPVFTNV